MEGMVNRQDPFKILSVARIRRVMDILGADTERCMDELTRIADQEDRLDQFWARTLTRALISWIEATTHEMKLVVQAAADAGFIDLSSGERRVLEEQSYELNDRAIPSPRPKYVPVDKLTRFVFHLFGRVYGIDVTLPVGENGWRQLLLAIRIRHRITHPKEPSNLEISTGEVTVVTEAFRWYFTRLAELLQRIRAQVATNEFLERLGLRGTDGA